MTINSVYTMYTDELVTCESVLCASDSTTRKVKPSVAAENTSLVIKFACIIDLKTSWFITPQGLLPCLWDDDAMHLFCKESFQNHESQKITATWPGKVPWRHGYGNGNGNGNNGQVAPRICRKKSDDICATSVPSVRCDQPGTDVHKFLPFQHFVASTQTASVCIYCIHVIMNTVPVVPMLHPKQRALVNMVNVSLTFATSDFILSWLHEAGNGSTRITTILRALPE